MNPLLRYLSYFLSGFNTLQSLLVCTEIALILFVNNLKMKNESSCNHICFWAHVHVIKMVYSCALKACVGEA